MPHLDNILQYIGTTPLVKLGKIVPKGSATILAKCEFLNPTGSIKDRMAAHIIEAAEKSGELKPGGTIVENTSGNTGLGVAMVAAVKGYRCIFTMPDKMSIEKVNMLKSFGAEVVITPTDVPGDSPQHYVQTAKRIARETPNSFYVNQYHNKANIEAHYLSTGPDIWRQTEGKFDAVVAGVGTGGTISGIGRYIKERSKTIKVIGVDPIGSIHYQYFHTRTMPEPHVYKVEGIGEDILCDACDYEAFDDIRQVNDQESFVTARRLVREEGLFCGGSSGSAVHVALQVAKELGPDKTVVVVLTDSATRYITKHLSDSWMKDHGFLEAGPALGTVDELLKSKPQRLILAHADDTLSATIQKMKQEGVSQVPVVDDSGGPIAIVHEIDILRSLQHGKVHPDTQVREIATPVSGLVYPKARVEELYPILESDRVAIVVDDNLVKGVIAKIDVIEYMSGMLNA